jgi:hypothetical protein
MPETEACASAREAQKQNNQYGNQTSDADVLGE